MLIYETFTAKGEKMIKVEEVVSKYKNCRDRDELEKRIKEHMDLALKHASNIVMAGQHSMVAFKLKEICDKLPPPALKKIPGSTTQGPPTKTAAISNEENAQINAAWEERAGGTRKDVKR